MPDQMDRLKAALGDRYDVGRLLGHGGSAEVYFAEDRKLHRSVAIKVLRPDVAAAVGPERFVREIKVTARLQHPNIVTVLESGSADGLLYFILEYVDGESLRQLLRRTGQLELGEAVRLIGEIAGALAYAHEQGVIHRDIKPENILLSGGHAVVTDFGLAKAMVEAGAERLTDTGIAMGTPWYMSPEQAGADHHVDARADIYSLACVLYEMLAGEPPFTGHTPQMIIARHMSQPPPPIRIVRSTVSKAVAAVMERGLAKVPADRYATVMDFADALRQAHEAPPPPETPQRRRTPAMAWLIGAAVLTVTGLVWQRVRARAAAGASDPSFDPSHIAVLALGAPGASSDLAAFAANLTGRLVDGLGAIDALTVVSRRAVQPYEKAGVPVDSMARALKVGTFVAGSVDAESNRVRISLELIDGKSGRQLNSTHVDAAFPERHFLVDAVADTVTRLLSQILGPTIRKRRQLLETRNVAAFERVQAAEARLDNFDAQLNERDLRAAHRTLDDADSLFAEAERLDARWVEPIVGQGKLAPFRVQLAAAERAPANPDWLRRGLAHAERAVQLEPDNPPALELRGTLQYQIWDRHPPIDTAVANALRDSAEANLRRAVEGNSDRSLVLRLLSEVVAKSGRLEEAVNLAERAYKLDPYLVHPDRIVLRLFDFNLEMGKDSAAARWCDEGIARFPDQPFFYDCQLQLMAWSDQRRPDPVRARSLMGRTLTYYPASLHPLLEPRLELLVGISYARLGQRDSARALLNRGLAAPRNPGTVIPAADILALLGQQVAGVDLLVTYVTQHPEARDAMRRMPGLRTLRQDPRLIAALAAPRRP
jgi:serine/threonine-protein kinase